MLPFLHVACEVVGVVLAVAALPLFAELLVLSVAALLPGRVPSGGAGAGPEPFRLAVIVPAHNEEMLISECVQSIAKASGPGVTAYVVAHNCSDRTAERAAAAGARVLTLNDTLGGKGVALDYGFGHALGKGAEGVLVIDADSVVSVNLTALVATRLAGGAAALQCRYKVANAEGNQRTRLLALAFLGMNVLRPRGRNRLGLSCGIFGNGFALAAETLRRVPYTANSLVEDLEYHLHLIDRGLRVEFCGRGDGVWRNARDVLGRGLATCALGGRPHVDAAAVGACTDGQSAAWAGSYGGAAARPAGSAAGDRRFAAGGGARIRLVYPMWLAACLWVGRVAQCAAVCGCFRAARALAAKDAGCAGRRAGLCALEADDDSTHAHGCTHGSGMGAHEEECGRREGLAGWWSFATREAWVIRPGR